MAYPVHVTNEHFMILTMDRTTFICWKIGYDDTFIENVYDISVDHKAL